MRRPEWTLLGLTMLVLPVDGVLVGIFGPIIPLVILTVAVAALVIVAAARIGLRTSCSLGGGR